MGAARHQTALGALVLNLCRREAPIELPTRGACNVLCVGARLRHQMKLDIGGGTKPARGYVNLDRTHGEGEWRREAQDTPWPIGDETVEAARASHFLEHVPKQDGQLIRVMNEIHRVLMMGAHFEIILPLVGYTDEITSEPRSKQIGWQPWADPTHVTFWWFPESLLYFCTGAFKPHSDYGIREWVLGGWSVEDGWEGHATLIKP
jgi:hypothetical protein